MENRRVLLLELLAWAIYNIESCEPDELREFEREPREVREEQWGIHPWSSAANDKDKYLRHVAGMARAFADKPVRYPNRKRHPVAA